MTVVRDCLRRNIEAKYRCHDLAAVAQRAREVRARDGGVLRQTDTFFGAPHARLKLRDFGDGRAELISYRRPDLPEARGSDYVVAPVSDPGQLEAALAHALDVVGIVRKRRTLLLVEHTRIHLDEVEGLGTFVELETVLGDMSNDDGRAELHRVADLLGLRPEDAVPLPYVDLRREAER